MKKVFVLLWMMFSLAAFSQSDDEPLIENLRKHFQKEYFRVGFVLQVVGDGQIERSFGGTNGFNISNMRLSVSGKLDKSFGYLMRVNFINSPAILDAKMNYRFGSSAMLDVGLFKAPFSKELLTAADAIDMVNRSQVVSVLSPGRQIGMQFGVNNANKTISAHAGVFNGNRYGGNANDNNDFLFAGRLAAKPLAALESDADLEIGVNAARSHDAGVPLGNGIRIHGNRLLVGGDLRLTTDILLLAGEYIWSDLERRNFFTNESVNPYGFHGTVGVMAKPNLQLLARYDSIKGDGLFTDTDLIILGCNIWPSQVTELQFNYIINQDDSEFKHHQLLINAQVAF